MFPSGGLRYEEISGLEKKKEGGRNYANLNSGRVRIIRSECLVWDVDFVRTLESALFSLPKYFYITY